MANGIALCKSIKAALDGRLASVDAHAALGAKEVASRRAVVSKLTAEYTTLARGLQDASVAANRVINSPLPLGAGSGAGAVAADGGAAYELTGSARGGKRTNEINLDMAQMQQVDLTELLIQEREQNIDEILTQTVQVNEVFKDLANLVDEQGQLIDKVETNVSSAQSQTQAGVGHLTTAAKYAAKYRCCLIWLLAILALVAVGVTLFILIDKGVIKFK